MSETVLCLGTLGPKTTYVSRLRRDKCRRPFSVPLLILSFLLTELEKSLYIEDLSGKFLPHCPVEDNEVQVRPTGGTPSPGPVFELHQGLERENLRIPHRPSTGT